MLNERILREKLRLFHQSIGWTFCLSSGLEDIVEGVDFNDKLVHGKQYGSFHISLCELRRAPAKKPSSTILPKLLAERNTEGRYDTLINKAESFLYDDYKFDLIDPECDYPCPKVMLVDDLSKFTELADLRQQAMDGVFDDEADEADKNRLREEMKEGGMSPAFMKEHFGL